MDVQDHTIPHIHATGRMQNYAELCKRMQTDANDTNVFFVSPKIQTMQLYVLYAPQKPNGFHRKEPL
jgi:hypothetical protein